MIGIRALWCRAVLGCLVTFSLTGCGGGGGGGGGSSSGNGGAPSSVVVAPQVVVQPLDQTVYAGGPAQFSSGASNPPVSVQWYRDGAPIAGATAATYRIDSTSMKDNGATFVAMFSNTAGSASSRAATLTVMAPPLAIATQPQPALAAQGAAATFDVTTYGLEPTYQWQRSDDFGTSWSNVSGATGSSFTTAPLGLSDHGAVFRVRIADQDTEMTSNWASLQVRPRLNLLAGKPGGCGYFNGVGDSVRFCLPSGVAVVGSSIFVFEPMNKVIRKIAADGTVSTFATVDAPNPYYGHMVADAAGNLYVALPNNGSIWKIQPNGESTVFAQLAANNFNASPTGLAIDRSTGNLFATDSGFNRIFKITPAGAVSLILDTGLLTQPEGIAVAPNGDLIVADSRNCVVRRVTQAGAASIVAGSAGLCSFTDANGASATFGWPEDVAVDSAGVIYVADANNHAVRRIATNGDVTTLAGNGTAGSSDGTGGAASLSRPYALALDGAGNLVVAELENHAVRRLTTAGQVTTVAGVPPAIGTADGSGGAARFTSPGVTAVGPDGTIYVIDGHSIRAVDPHGAVSTLAGNPVVNGYANGSAATALFDYPMGLAVAANGDVFVADHQNCEIRRISGGLVTSFAGRYHICGYYDGAYAMFNDLHGIVFAANGDLLVADDSAVRRITPSGVVSTVAGFNDNYKTTQDGPIASARFYYVGAIAVDGDAIYVVDYSNVIRKIADGQVTTQWVDGIEGISYIPSMTVHNGKLYFGLSDGSLGLLDFNDMGIGAHSLRPMFGDPSRMLFGATSYRTVQLGADSKINMPNGFAFTGDGRLVIATENALLISD